MSDTDSTPDAVATAFDALATTLTGQIMTSVSNGDFGPNSKFMRLGGFAAAIGKLKDEWISGAMPGKAVGGAKRGRKSRAQIAAENAQAAAVPAAAVEDEAA